MLVVYVAYGGIGAGDEVAGVAVGVVLVVAYDGKEEGHGRVAVVAVEVVVAPAEQFVGCVVGQRVVVEARLGAGVGEGEQQQEQGKAGAFHWRLSVWGFSEW